MELTQALNKARRLMDENGLNNWTLSLNRCKTAFGKCSSHKKTIWLSQHLTELNDEANVTNTILHEIAHALVGTDQKHNYRWQSQCIRLGIEPKRCGSGASVKPNYVGECTWCKDYCGGSSDGS